MTHWRCISYAMMGLLTGCAALAQDGSVPALPAPTSTESLVLEGLRVGGLPGVLALTGWMVGRGGIPVTLQLSDKDRELLQRLADEDEKKPRSR